MIQFKGQRSYPLINTKQLLLIVGLLMSSIFLVCSVPEVGSPKEQALRDIKKILEHDQLKFEPERVKGLFKALEALPANEPYESVARNSFWMLKLSAPFVFGRDLDESKRLLYTFKVGYFTAFRKAEEENEKNEK